MGQLILEHEGTLERFTGDGMMIFFNDPVPVDDPAERAVRMALAMRERVARLGAAGGSAATSSISASASRRATRRSARSASRAGWDYGAIGTVTNLAARLCGEAAGGQILISQRVQACVADFARTEPVGELTLKGFHRPVPTFAVMGCVEAAVPAAT